MYELRNILFARKCKTETYDYTEIEMMRLKLRWLILGEKNLAAETNMHEKLTYQNIF